MGRQERRLAEANKVRVDFPKKQIQNGHAVVDGCQSMLMLPNEVRLRAVMRAENASHSKIHSLAAPG